MLSNRNNETVIIQKEIEAANNLIFLHNVKHGNLINLKIIAQLDSQSIIPGSIPLLVEEIIKSNIISDARPLEITLTQEDDYITLSHKLNERLKKNNHEAKTIERLQVAYSFYTDQPLVKVHAYGEAFYKIPLLNLSHVAA